MARKTSKFMVGLFTTLGVVIGVIAIIWVGASKYFEKGDRYVTYFDESVQGLQKDSAVKYRGVEVGRVETIRVAPDNNLIAVIMKVNLKEDLSKTAVAQLKMAGITGLVFVELDRKDPGEKYQSPKINFPAEYPVIASRPSETAKIMSGVNAVVEKFNKIEPQGAIDQIRTTASEIQIFLKGKRLEAILENLEVATKSIKDITGRVDKTVADGKVDDVLVGALVSVKEAQALLATIRGEVRGMNLPETMVKTRAIAADLMATSENLRRSTETLESFMSRIYERPPDLIFGKPPKGRFNE